MKRWLYTGGIGLSLCLIIYFGFLFFNTEGTVEAFAKTVREQPSALIASGAILSLLPLIGFFVWLFLLRFLGERHSIYISAKIFFISQFARYLPGNVGHLIGRLWLANRHGYNSSKVGLSLLLEALILINSAFLFIALGAMIQPSLLLSINRLENIQPGRALICSIMILSLLFLPFLSWLLWKTSPSKNHSTFLQILKQLTSVIPIGLVMSLLTFLALTWSTQLLLVTAYQIEGIGFGTLFIASTLAWVAGFLTPGAPAGLGVREIVLLSFFSSSMTQSIALEVCLMLRILTILTDGLYFLAGLSLNGFKRKRLKDIA